MKNIKLIKIIISLFILINSNFIFSQSLDTLFNNHINEVLGTWEDGKGIKIRFYLDPNIDLKFSSGFLADGEYTNMFWNNTSGKENYNEFKKYYFKNQNCNINRMNSEIYVTEFKAKFKKDIKKVEKKGDKPDNTNNEKTVYQTRRKDVNYSNIFVMFDVGDSEPYHLELQLNNGLLSYLTNEDHPAKLVRTVKENINNEQEVSNKEIIINLYHQTYSSVYTSPGDNSSCKLQADVDCSDAKAKSGRKVKIEFVSDKLGSFDANEATTGADGKAFFTYTAPNESVLNGKDEITIQVKATDVASGETSVIPISILNRNVKSGFYAQHIIMPQGAQFYNELKILINAPPKGDGYPATITTKDPLGLITGSKDKAGGESPVYIKIKPGQEYKYYYHNTGVVANAQPIEEEVTLEIPELNFKQVVIISVGVDFMVQNIERKWNGAVYPGLPEPLEIYITDNFHPNIDLEKIFSDFDIKMRVRIEPSQISQEPVMSKYADDYISRFTTLFEGHIFGKNIVTSSGDAFVTIRKTNDGKYVLCKTSREALPFVLMFDRGMYEFNIELIDINYPENNINNSKTIAFTVEQYRDGTDELLKTALIPMSKVLIDFLTGGLMAYGDVVSATADATMYEGAIKDGKLLDAAVGLFGIVCGSIEGSKQIKNYLTGNLIPVTETMKRTIKMVTLSSNVLQIVNLIINEKKGGSQKQSYKDISDKLKYPQAFIKGSKKHYIIIMDNTGLKNYSATLKNGNKISPLADKLLNNSSIEQRIDANNDYVIIPCENEEEVSLNLDFNGTGGFLYRVTKDKIDKVEFPKNSSSVKVNINSSNALTLGKQEEKKDDNNISLGGSWETAEFGTMTIILAGNNVAGTYSKNIGIISGSISSDGKKITGTWSNFPTYSSPNDAGKFEITISNDGKTFSGKWGKGTDDKAKMDKTFKGTKK